MKIDKGHWTKTQFKLQMRWKVPTTYSIFYFFKNVHNLIIGLSSDAFGHKSYHKS